MSNAEAACFSIKQLGHCELLVSSAKIPLHRQHGLPQRLQEAQVGEKKCEEEQQEQHHGFLEDAVCIWGHRGSDGLVGCSGLAR